MVKYYPSITDNLAEWAMKQYVFFTASAPLNGKHINLSPKGLASTTFTIFGPNQCGYVDATGSGNETISHIYENGRVTIMFCSFETAPRIMRFFCKGRVVETDSAEFWPLVKKMDKNVVGVRAVILLDVFMVQTSCGFGVPLLQKNDAEGEKGKAAAAAQKINKKGEERKDEAKEKGNWGFEDRATLGHWAGNKIERGELQEYQRENNSRSLDDLPGLKTAMRDNGDFIAWVQLQARARRIVKQRDGFVGGLLVGLLAFFVLNLLMHQLHLQPVSVLKAPW